MAPLLKPATLLLTTLTLISARPTVSLYPRSEDLESFAAVLPRQDIPEALSIFPTGLLNQFLRLLSTLPPGEAALDAAGRVLTPIQQKLADAVNIETNRTDLVSSTTCADMTVVFARGTTEPGNVGLVTGPPFFKALEDMLAAQGKTLAIQGVDYPATFKTFNGDGQAGVPSMTNYLTSTLSRCPNSKVVMSGYSQGALVTRGTAAALPSDAMTRISSVLTFGDPKNQDAITGSQGKRLTICHDDDDVCKGGFINLGHLTYATDAVTAATFVTKQAGF